MAEGPKKLRHTENRRRRHGGTLKKVRGNSETKKKKGAEENTCGCVHDQERTSRDIQKSRATHTKKIEIDRQRRKGRREQIRACPGQAQEREKGATRQAGDE